MDGEGRLRWEDAVRKHSFVAELSTDDAGVSFSGEGKYSGMPLKAKGRTGHVLSIRDEDTPFPIQAELSIGATSAELEGTLTGIVGFKGIDLQFHRLSGKSMDELYDIIGLAFPAPQGLAGLDGPAAAGGRELEATLRRDLERSGVFELLGPAELAVLTLTGDLERDADQYRSLGAAMLLQSELKTEEGRLVLEGRPEGRRTGRPPRPVRTEAVRRSTLVPPGARRARGGRSSRRRTESTAAVPGRSRPDRE